MASESVRQKSPTLLLAAVVLGSCMAFIDDTVVNVAVPAIQKDFHASLSAMQWVVNGYTLILGAFILIGGSLGDHLGRKKVFLAGVTLFAIASLLCGLSPTENILIAARILQGFGGAMLIPGSLAIITAAFDDAERGKAIGVWASGSAISTAIGPLLGGWLVDHVSWRAAFFINIPIGVITILLAIPGIPESKDPNQSKIDWLSGGLAALALGGISYALIQAPESGWIKPDILAALAIGTVFLIAFITRQLRAADPMAPPELFKSKTFAGVNAMTLLLYGALAGALFFLPFDLIQVRGYSAAAAGASFLPFTVLMGGFSRWAGGLVSKFGSKMPLVVGPSIVALGFVLLAFAPKQGPFWTTLFPGIVVMGAGMTVTVAPLTATVMGSIPKEKSGVGSGINNAVSRIAGLLATATLGLVMVNVYTTHLPSSQSASANQLLAAPLPANASDQDKTQIKKARIVAFEDGFRIVMLLAAALAATSAIIAAATVDGIEGTSRGSTMV
jgi:EmrB/QacA subfamily drug resistance transporter